MRRFAASASVASFVFAAAAVSCSRGSSGAANVDASGAGAAGGGAPVATAGSAAAGGVAGASAAGAGGQAAGLPASGASGSDDGGPAAGTGGVRGDASAARGDGAEDAAGGPCGVGTTLCEDFEAYATPEDLAAAWTPTIAAATLTVDTTKPWRGTRALHIKAAAGSPVAVIAKQGAPLFPIAGNVMYGRVMMWLTATPGGDYHWNNIQAAGNLPGATTWGKYGWGGQFGKVLAGYTVRATATAAAKIDCSKPSASAFPTQKWVCVEWQFDGGKNEMHLWFDGALLTDVDVVGTGTRCVANGDLGRPWSAPTFSFLSLGWQQYQSSNGPLELWMDDVAVGSQRIGCPVP